jgi:GT2 family glycosyltransferase
MGEGFAGQIKVAVVILNWNGKKFLEQFLPSLVQNSKYEHTSIFIADNGSTDDSVSFLKEKYPDIKLVLLDKNYGFTGGYNNAIEQIDSQYYVLINSDVEVTENWLKPIIDLMDENPEIAACQPKILSYTQKEFFEYAGAAGGFIDRYGYPFCRGRILKEHEIDKGQYNGVNEIFWATGACMFVRADLFKKAGGFDEDFFAHMEEIDLCWRLKNMGYKIFYNSTSTVYHVGGGTLPNNNPQKLYLNYRNNLFILFKNLPSKQRFKIMFIRMLLDGASAFVYLFNGSFSFYWAVFRAHIRFYLSIKKLRIKRGKMNNIYNSFEHNQVYKGSIVKAFFVKKVKKFSDLTAFPEKQK